jgi:hypothetical protein
MYDVVFISFNEPNAEKNWQILKKKNGKIKRIHGIKGIQNAHKIAAKLVDTEMFYVVDGDAIILESFNFDYEIPEYDTGAKKTVHVWRSKNPINDLVYGYGGVKLLPKHLTQNLNIKNPDIATSISDFYKPVNVISNITEFNTDPFNTWKSAFRECAKLSSKMIDRQKSFETEERLEVWCTRGIDRPFGKFAIDGAKEGKKFGLQHKNEMNMINNFDWLKNKFKETYGEIN